MSVTWCAGWIVFWVYEKLFGQCVQITLGQLHKHPLEIAVFWAPKSPQFLSHVHPGGYVWILGILSIRSTQNKFLRTLGKFRSKDPQHQFHWSTNWVGMSVITRHLKGPRETLIKKPYILVCNRHFCGELQHFVLGPSTWEFAEISPSHKLILKYEMLRLCKGILGIVLILPAKKLRPKHARTPTECLYPRENVVKIR